MTRARTAGGVLLSVIASGLLAVASLFFAFYGYCEDACDKPDRAFWPAVASALPFALGAFVLLTVALVLMDRRRPARWLRAAGLAALASIAFLAGLALLLAVLAGLDATSGARPFVVGLLFLVAAWTATLATIARRAP